MNLQSEIRVPSSLTLKSRLKLFSFFMFFFFSVVLISLLDRFPYCTCESNQFLTLVIELEGTETRVLFSLSIF